MKQALRMEDAVRWNVKLLASKHLKTGIKLKSLILAQIERWRNALHMQVER